MLHLSENATMRPMARSSSKRRSNSLSDLRKRERSTAGRREKETTMKSDQKAKIPASSQLPGKLEVNIRETLQKAATSGQTTLGKFLSLRNILKRSCADVTLDIGKVNEKCDKPQDSREVTPPGSNVPRNVDMLLDRSEDIKSMSDLDEGSSTESTKRLARNQPSIIPEARDSASESSGRATAPSTDKSSSSNSAGAAGDDISMTPKTKLIHEQQEEIEMLRAKLRQEKADKAKSKDDLLRIVLVADLECTVDANNQKESGMYSGPTLKGRTPHGFGVLKFHNGDIYEGPFKFGEMHGKNALFYGTKGDRFEGDYWHNLQHGTGERLFATGHRYVGSYQFGQQHGFGVEYDADGAIVHLGQWHAGNPVVKESKMKELNDAISKCSEREDRMNRYIDDALSSRSRDQLSSSGRSHRQGMTTPVVAVDIPGVSDDDSVSSVLDGMSSMYDCSVYN